MMLKAILFDLDGTMVDTEVIYWDVARQMARELGKTVTEDTLRGMLGVSRLTSMQVFARDLQITDKTPEQLLVEREQLMAERYRRGVEPMPGLLRILKQFRGRLQMGVVTSSPRRFTDILLPGMKIRDYFDVIQTGDGIKNGKPDPEIYLTGMRQLAIRPNQCVVLEDSQAGVTSGHRSGAYVIAVPNELTAAQDFSVADRRAANLDEAARLIEELLERGST